MPIKTIRWNGGTCPRVNSGAWWRWVDGWAMQLAWTLCRIGIKSCNCWESKPGSSVIHNTYRSPHGLWRYVSMHRAVYIIRIAAGSWRHVCPQSINCSLYGSAATLKLSHLHYDTERLLAYEWLSVAAGAIYGSRGYYWVRCDINMMWEEVEIDSAIFWVILPWGLAGRYRLSKAHTTSVFRVEDTFLGNAGSSLRRQILCPHECGYEHYHHLWCDTVQRVINRPKRRTNVLFPSSGRTYTCCYDKHAASVCLPSATRGTKYDGSSRFLSNVSKYLQNFTASHPINNHNVVLCHQKSWRRSC